MKTISLEKIHKCSARCEYIDIVIDFEPVRIKNNTYVDNACDKFGTNEKIEYYSVSEFDLNFINPDEIIINSNDCNLTIAFSTGLSVSCNNIHSRLDLITNIHNYLKVNCNRFDDCVIENITYDPDLNQINVMLGFLEI